MPQSNEKAIAKRCHLQTLQQHAQNQVLWRTGVTDWQALGSWKRWICPVDTTRHVTRINVFSCFLSWALDSFSDLIRQGSRKVSNDISTQCLRTRDKLSYLKSCDLDVGPRVVFGPRSQEEPLIIFDRWFRLGFAVSTRFGRNNKQKLHNHQIRCIQRTYNLRTTHVATLCHFTFTCRWATSLRSESLRFPTFSRTSCASTFINTRSIPRIKTYQKKNVARPKPDFWYLNRWCFSYKF